MTPEHTSVTEANDAFYRALSNADLAAMSEVWFPGDWTECVHPGAVPIRGWEAVRDSWRQIFDNGARVAVSVTEVRVRLLGDVAWASCLERIATAEGDEIRTSLAHATNLFVRHDGRWRLALHHASPVPFLAPQISDTSNLVN